MSDSEELLDLLATATSASDQLKFIQTAYGSSGLVELSLQEADEILKKLGEGKSRKDQVTALATSRDERLVSCLMDVAMAPLTMTPSMLRHLERVIGTASVKSVSPAKIAHLLDQLEEQCFLSAAQATTLLRATQHRDDEKKRRFEYCHVICSRVIDRWNLTQDEHTEVSCYYGWSPAYLITLVQQAVGARPAELIEEQGADAPQEKPEAKPEEGKPEGKPEGKESSAKERKHEREEAGQPPEGMCWDARSAVELQNRVLGEQSATEQGNPPTMSRKLQNRILSQACSQAPRLVNTYYTRTYIHAQHAHAHAHVCM
jgi:hypothetical protein